MGSPQVGFYVIKISPIKKLTSNSSRSLTSVDFKGVKPSRSKEISTFYFE
jgi:hypothetical protein